MKAYVLNGIGQLEYMDVSKPVLQEGFVLVEVMATGICGSDIPRIFENGTYHFPTIPGHEFAGVVKEVFSEKDQEWLGKRVAVFPLMPCKTCVVCRKQNYEMCSHYDFIGSRRDGSFAEYVAVPAWNLIEVPKDIPFEAAAMLEPAAVGVHALRMVSWMNTLTKQEMKERSAVIFGPGTIGLLMAQWLKIFGVGKVIMVGTREVQRELALDLGGDFFVNSTTADVVLEIMKQTDDEGVDISIDCAGYGSVLGECLNVTKRGGDILIVGNPHGDVSMKRDVYWKLLRKQLRIYGTWNSSFIPECDTDDWRETILAILSGALQPQKQITHCLAFDELHKGLEIMRNKSEYYNKIMILRDKKV